jgi:hypothetical protein
MDLSPIHLTGIVSRTTYRVQNAAFELGYARLYGEGTTSPVLEAAPPGLPPRPVPTATSEHQKSAT